MELRTMIYRKEDGVAQIIKNRPPMNSINRAMMEDLRDCLKDAEADPEVSVVVIDAQGGDRQFHGGADIGILMTSDHVSPWMIRETVKIGHGVYSLIEDLSKPVVAVVRGGAGGGGCEMTLACDFVIAAEDATFSQGEVSGGIIPGWGGTQRLIRLVGPRKATDMILSCQPVNGAEAARIGLVTKAVPRDQLDAEVQRLVESLKAKPPTVVGLAKSALKVAMDSSLKDGLRYEVEAETLCLTTQQQKVAWNARVGERRDPKRSDYSKERRLQPGDDWK